jgi:hypothetical protein
MLYSDGLAPYTGPLSAAVQEALRDIKQYFEVDDLKVLSFDRWHIVIPVNYLVSLPTNGAVNGLDIRANEPMLIKLSLEDYPNFVPFILSDRKDFPKDQLSHLYFTEPEEPARLCLVRGNPYEWFANAKLFDLLDVAGQWLYKAATGKLNGDGNEFDPTRLEGNVRGRHVYKYNILNDVASNDRRIIPDYPMAIFVAGLYFTKASRVYYKTLRPVPLIALETTTKVVTEFYAKEKNDSANSPSPIFSFLFWHPDNKVEELYLTSLPKNYGQLKLFFSIRGISLIKTLTALEQQGTLIKCGVPIIYAMKRPLKMIGYNGYYEFFNFLLTMPTGGVDALTDDAPVSIQGHTEPFSPELAATVAGRSSDQATLFVGAGSLGSKLIFHDARSGNFNVGAVDNDDLEQHNLVRHELFAGHVGSNKAKAIIAEIRQFYPVDNTDNLKAFDKSLVLMDEEFEEYRYLIDSTASAQVSNYLTLKNLPPKLTYVKSEIVHSGQLGLLYAEGENRNPRIDDLSAVACFKATEDVWLKEWRAHDVLQTKENLNVGLGCSSATVVMPDDLISFHASTFSLFINEHIKRESPSDGLIYLSAYKSSKEGSYIASREYRISPFEILKCKAGSGWQLRLMVGITQKLINLCNQHAPIETGGVLVGMANYKTKVIHVFDIITEPQDSKGTCVGFIRGIKGLPEEIDHIKNVTGNMIGYIGEWHSHPMNLKRLSTRDQETIADLKKLNSAIPIPTCAVIVTPDEVLAFVYE